MYAQTRALVRKTEEKMVFCLLFALCSCACMWCLERLFSPSRSRRRLIRCPRCCFHGSNSHEKRSWRCNKQATAIGQHFSLLLNPLHAIFVVWIADGICVVTVVFVVTNIDRHHPAQIRHFNLWRNGQYLHQQQTRTIFVDTKEFCAQVNGA